MEMLKLFGKVFCFMAVCMFAVLLVGCTPYIGTVNDNKSYEEYIAEIYIGFNNASANDYITIKELIISKLPAGVEYEFGELKNNTMPLVLTIKDAQEFGIPDSTLLLKKDLWYQYGTVTHYNPFNILADVPQRSGVNYFFYIEQSYRSTKTNADLVTHESGKYQYFWEAENLQAEGVLDDIVFYDKMANSATYYILAIIIAVVIGVIVYFVAKRNHKKRNTLTPPFAQ